MPYRSTIRLDCVPFPAPGGPRRITGPIFLFRAALLAVDMAGSLAIEMAPFTRISCRGNTALLRACNAQSPRAAAAQAAALRRESIIVPHDQLRLDLRDRVHRDSDYDQQRGAAKIKIDAQAVRYQVGRF